MDTPNVIAVRPEEDIKLLIAKVKGSGPKWAKNNNTICNHALRVALTGLVDSKRIRNLQDKLGVSVPSK